MGLLLFALFVGIPLIEIMLFIQIGGAIGTGMTIVIVIVTAMMGSMLLRWQGLATLSKARSSLDRSEIPVDSVVHAIFLVIAGALLLTPGFLTDAIGFLLFLPPFRLALGRWMLNYIMTHGTVSVHVQGGQPGHQPGNKQKPDGKPYIDGEAEEVDDERP